MKNIILLHGALGASSQFAQLNDLLRHNYQVHLVEFPGHGKSANENDFSIEFFADSLKEFIETEKIESATIFGYSMGGYVALLLAKNHPNLVKKIITLGTKFDWNPESSLKESQLLNPEKIQEKVPAFASSLQLLHGDNWKTVLTKTADMMLKMGTKNPLEENDFRSIGCECILGVGDNDTMVSQEETRRIASWIPNAEFYLLENTIHPIEKVDLNKLVNIINQHA